MSARPVRPLVLSFALHLGYVKPLLTKTIHHPSKRRPSSHGDFRSVPNCRTLPVATPSGVALERPDI
eukprot:15466295-Alexandrium_andersonii.AAC.1